MIRSKADRFTIRSRICSTFLIQSLRQPPLAAASRERVFAVLSEITKTNTSAHWIDALNKAGVPSGPINSIDMTFAERPVRTGLVAVQRADVARLTRVPGVGKIDHVHEEERGVFAEAGTPRDDRCRHRELHAELACEAGLWRVVAQD